MTVDRKLRLRLELIAALPEPIMLDRLRRLSKAELIAFRRLFGIRECCCKGRCAIHQHRSPGRKAGVFCCALSVVIQDRTEAAILGEQRIAAVVEYSKLPATSARRTDTTQQKRRRTRPGKSR